jgi:hypothetical protein
MRISIATVSLPLFNALAIEWLIVLRWLYWADCTDSWWSPNASSPLYIASYIYANVCGRLDLCLVLRYMPTRRAFCALS